MTSIHPTADSEDNSSDVSEAVVKSPPPAFVVKKDDFTPKGLVPGASLEKLGSTTILKIRPNKTLYNATASNDFPNRFIFLDESDRQLFIGHETSDIVSRCAFGRSRGYTMSLMSESNDAMLEIQKEYSLLSSFGCCSFFGKFGHMANINDNQGQSYGRIVQKFEVLFPYYELQDADNCPRFEIISLTVGCCLPVCSPNSDCNQSNIFAIYRPDSRVEIGYLGIEKEGDKSSFLKFPDDCSTSDRILLMSALVHVHILYLNSICGCEC